MKTYHTEGTNGVISIIENQAMIVNNVEDLRKTIELLSFHCTISLFVTQGHAQWCGTEMPITLCKGDFLIHNLENSKASIIPDGDFGMNAICVSSEFRRQFSQSIKISWSIRQALITNALFHLSPEDRHLMVDNLDFLTMKCLSDDYPQRPLILKQLLHILSVEVLLRLEQYILDLGKAKENHKENEKHDISLGNATSAQIIFNRFTHLLEKTIVKNRPVSWWASQLNISPKYLSAVCKEVEGKSARTMIAETVIQEAIILLRNPSLTIKEISDRLGFVNQSHFGTFFKRHTGHSPIKRDE